MPNIIGHISVIIRRYSSIEEKRLSFLYDKKVLADDIIKRDLEFSRINNISLLPSGLQKHYINCQRRLDRILEKNGDNVSDTTPKDVQSFEQFCAKSPIWKDENRSYVFFRDHRNVRDKNVLAQRAQLSSLCYIHGPDMLQHYLVSMNTVNPIGMIDISKLIRDTFDAEQLRKHIFEDAGGNSLIILKYILTPDSITKTSESDRYETNLRLYGPGLVSQFLVYSDFHNDNEHIHIGRPKLSEKIGMHAMVLIGATTTYNMPKRYLLQNWWKPKQFVEVDEEYLEYCSPIIHFVKTPQLSIPDKFPLNLSFYAENENVDKPESYAFLEK